MTNPARTEVKAIPLREPLKTLTLGSRWLSEGDSRFDATAYEAGAFAAIDAIERCGVLSSPLSICVGGIQHPTQNQPRSNFKRIWVRDIVHGFPFVSGRQLLHFRLPRERFVSRSVPKMAELRVPVRFQWATFMPILQAHLDMRCSRKVHTAQPWTTWNLST